MRGMNSLVRKMSRMNLMGLTYQLQQFFFKGRIKRILLMCSIVGSFKNGQTQEIPNGKRQVILRFTHHGHDAQTCL